MLSLCSKGEYFKKGLCNSQRSLFYSVEFGTYRLYLSELALFLSELLVPLRILPSETILMAELNSGPKSIISGQVTYPH